MRRKNFISLIILLAFGLVIAIGCSASIPLEEKSGAQLWGENCVRCHNAPAPTAFSDTQWEAITQHMRIRANLSALQTEKVLEFLKMAN